MLIGNNNHSPSPQVQHCMTQNFPIIKIALNKHICIKKFLLVKFLLLSKSSFETIYNRYLFVNIVFQPLFFWTIWQPTWHPVIIPSVSASICTCWRQTQRPLTSTSGVISVCTHSCRTTTRYKAHHETATATCCISMEALHHGHSHILYYA